MGNRAPERVYSQGLRHRYGTRFDTRYFEALLDEIREIRASERMVYQKITDIYATVADKEQPHMGLTTWRTAPSGKVLKSDIKIAKNYLSKEELKEMNHIVNMYLDYAELQASRGRLMKMRDWEEKL